MATVDRPVDSLRALIALLAVVAVLASISVLPLGSLTSTPAGIYAESVPEPRSVDRLSDSETIVVGVDGSPESDAALGWAIGESRVTRRRVVLVHVTSVPEDLAGGIITLFGAQDASSYPNEVLERCERLCREADISASTALIQGSVPEQLAEASRRASMLVIGSSGHGAAADFARGSAMEGILHRASCPVVVVKTES